MRFTLAQLRKLPMPHNYIEELDLSEELANFEDIISAKNAYVNGEIVEIGKDKYQVNMNINIELTLSSAISLKEVPFKIEVDCSEIYATNSEDDEDINLIVGQTIDTREAVITNVIINKPMRVVGEGEELDYENTDSSVDSEINNPFASLKDLLNK